ncbi:hypothetical protein R6Q57_011173, partial [Mikania cordata]
MESKREDGNILLSEGDVCGEELLIWCLEHLSLKEADTRNHRKQGNKLVSKRTVICLTNVEAFVLRAVELEEITTLFAVYLRNHRVQMAI